MLCRTLPICMGVKGEICLRVRYHDLRLTCSLTKSYDLRLKPFEINAFKNGCGTQHSLPRDNA